MATNPTAADAITELLSTETPAPAPVAVPNWRTDPDFIEAETRRAAIDKELNDLSDELDRLVGDGEERGTLPPAYRRMTAEQARIEREAFELAGDKRGAELLGQVERLATIKARKPVVERAAELARVASEKAADTARRALAPKAAEAYKPAGRVAALSILAAAADVTAAADLHDRLRFNGFDVPNALAGNPLIVRPENAAALQLRSFVAAGLLTAGEVKEAFPDLTV